MHDRRGWEAIRRMTRNLSAHHIMNGKKKFKTPPGLETYDDTVDPTDHVQNYKSIMELRGAFSTTLGKAARDWYNKLPRSQVRPWTRATRAQTQEGPIFLFYNFVVVVIGLLGCQLWVNLTTRLHEKY